MLTKIRRRKQACTQKLTQDELKSTIVAAFEQIDRERAEQAKEALKNDELAETTRTLLKTTFLLIISALGIAFIMLVASMIPGIKFSDLDVFYTMSKSDKILYAVFSPIFIYVCIRLVRAVNKETDRNFLVSYFSAITAIVALIVALVK